MEFSWDGLGCAIYNYNLGTICGRKGVGCLCDGGEVPSLRKQCALAIALKNPCRKSQPLTWRDMEMLVEMDVPHDLADLMWHALGIAHFKKNKYDIYRMRYCDIISWRNSWMKHGGRVIPLTRANKVIWPFTIWFS